MFEFFITLVIIGCIALVLWGAWNIYSGMLASKIMQNGRNKKNFTYNYLSVRFSRLNTMKNVRLEVRNRDAENGRYVSDIGLVFVNRGGVFIIDQNAGSGFIDVNQGGKWSRVINDKYFAFDDPFIKNTVRVKDMKTFLHDEGVDNVPIHNIVLFTGRRVKFSKRLNGLINADELTPFMIDLNKDKFLTGGEIRKIVKLIKSKQI